MSIDWFTVIAQALNLLLLLWLMKRFLYKPVLHAVDERERLIAEKLADAETKKDAAGKEKEEYESKNDDLSRQGAAFLKKAQDEGQTEKQRLLEDAREAAEALSRNRHEALVTEEKALRQEVSRRIQKEVLAITQKILTDLAEISLEEQMVKVFTRRLSNLDDGEIKALTSSLKTQPGRVTLRTAFDISPELRASAGDSVRKIIGTKPEIAFETASELISGIELNVNGQKIAWSVSDYLSSIAEDFEDILKDSGGSKKTEPEKKN